MSVEEAVQTLRDSPELLEHVADLNRFTEDEKRRREQFYKDLDEDTKAEFINGQVVVHSPVRRGHLQAGFFIVNLLGNFVLRCDLGEAYSEKCLIQCKRNDYELDLCFFSRAKCEGWNKDKLFFPPPDLVVEILSPSAASNDRSVKLHDYARHGVAEYWIIGVDELTVEQHTLPLGPNYETKTLLSGDDYLTSVAVPGFTVPVAAFFDAQENQRALRELLGQA